MVFLRSRSPLTLCVRERERERKKERAVWEMIIYFFFLNEH